MNKIESYVDSVIPKNIPKSKQKMLRAEIEAHIFDRIDFYTDIGYDTGASIDTAIADMGEDEDVKSSIRNNFEELHFERTWWAVAVGILTVLISFISLLVEFSFDIDFNDSYGMPEKIKVFPYLCSSIVTFLFVVFAIVLYKKGLRKCLLSLGLSSLISGAMFSTYLLSAVWKVSVYFLTKYTDISLSISEDISYYGGVLIVLLAVTYTGMCIRLANKIKENGKPKIKFRFVAMFSALYLIVCVVSINNLLPAAQYFSTYPYWFHTDFDTVSEQASSIYNQLENATTVEQTEKIMADNGYISVDDYEKTLDKEVAKKFRYNFEQIKFFFSDDYEIWHNQQCKNSDESGNGFVYILRDEKGLIKSKGVGNAFSNLRTAKGNYGNIPDKVQTFLSYKSGEELTDILDYFNKEYGAIYCEFTTYTETGEDNYYRIVCNGHCPYGMWNSKGTILDIYIELWFENGALTDGKLHYPEFHYQEGEEGYSYSYDNYYTLAD